MKAKRFLFSVIAICGAMFMSIDAYAQWEEPTPPQLTEINAESIESGKAYFIKNVGAGQFITGANNWSTQASLTQAGINSDLYEGLSPAIAFYVSDTTGVSTNLAGVQGVSLRLNGTYKFYGNYAERTLTNTYFYRDNEQWGFMDNNSLPRGYIWDITKTENGYYRIQTAEGDPTFPNASSQYAGWDNSLGPIEADPDSGELLDGSVSTLVQFNLTGENENECIDWMFIRADEFLAQKEIYLARVALYEKYLETLETAEAEELDVDMSSAETIYNNPNATVAELDSAIADLTYQVNSTFFQRELAEATPEDPIEATEICLVNPAFEDDNINGWKCTFVSGQTANNVGFQGASYTNNGTTLTEIGSAVNEDDQPAYLNRFIEAWRPNEQDPHHIGDAELSQTVYGLPTGVYKLTCDANAVQQGSYFPNPVEGVKLFIATDTGKEVSIDIATGNGNPEHFSVTFTCPEGVKAMTFGLKTENTTANWIAADNFRIYYYGNSGDLVPEMLILMDQVKAAEEAGYTADNNANADVLSNYIDALDAANLIVALGSSATAEQCENATSILKAAFNAAKQSIKDYITLQGYIDEATDLVSKCSDAGFAEAADAVEDLLEDWETAYEDKTATKEQIDAMGGVAHDTMMEAIGEADIPVGTDLTFLLSNPGFTTGTTANPTGWTINSGSMSELRASTHNIETWHKTFDISQTIANMPAGVYDITVQGFVRHDGAKTDGTWLYGGISKAYLIDLDNDIEQKVTEENRIYTDAKPAMGDTNYDNSRGISADGEGNTLYQCNGMTGAYYWFQETNPKTGELFYTNHVQLILDKKGDLTIGIHTEATEDWVIFDNFKIMYFGTANNKLDVVSQTIEAGNSTTVEIKLKNDQADLVAFQMDLTLPEGISLDKTGCSLSSRITDQEQELAIGKLSDNVYRLTSSSLSLTPIEGNNGTLLSLKLNAEDGCVNGKATISNILFSTANSERITMIDESFDINIMYKQIYTVDGEEYKSYNVVYNSQPTFETEPIKAGYTFGGWSELPEAMPNHNIEITGRFYLYGDVNTDEEVDVVDVVDIARFVVATPSEKFREKLADLNSDETVNLGDAVVLVNHIAGDQNFVKPMFAPSICADNDATLRLTKNGKAISLEMTNSRDYTAFQFDLYMLEYADVTEMQLNVQRKQTHSMLYNKVGNGHYRVAVLSPSNITINGNNGELLSFVVDGGTSSDVSIKNIQFFDTKGNAYLFDAVGIDTETSIDSVVTINNNEAGAMYDLQGRKLSKVQRGVNIVGGKALIVK